MHKLKIKILPLREVNIFIFSLMKRFPLDFISRDPTLAYLLTALQTRACEKQQS